MTGGVEPVEGIDLVFSGSGTLLPCHGGAMHRLESTFRVERVGGTSGGGVLALARAAEMSIADVRSMCEDFLARDLLDLSPWPFDGWGLYAGDRVRNLLSDVFGRRRMAELALPCRVVVGDRWTETALVVSQDSHPDALVVDVARSTMAIPGFFKAWHLDPKQRRRFVDGGVVKNFPVDVFDDVPDRRTVGVHFAHAPRDPCLPPDDSLAGAVRALYGLRQSAADRDRSSKAKQTIVAIVTDGDSLRFKLDTAEIRKRWCVGYDAADRALRGSGVPW